MNLAQHLHDLEVQSSLRRAAVLIAMQPVRKARQKRYYVTT